MLGRGDRRGRPDALNDAAYKRIGQHDHATSHEDHADDLQRWCR